MPTTYRFPAIDEFIDRGDELSRLEDWWAGSERMPLNLYGRRRVGKSWLLRRFAHGKPTVFLVAERLAEGAQLTRFAEQLSPLFAGVAPALPDVAALFRTLFRASRETPLLAVIDEFPWLLGTTTATTQQILSQIQAVLDEERDSSQLKLVLCGSAVAQMAALQSEKNPLHGRLIGMELRPVDFATAKRFLGTGDPIDAFTRFAIAGGMPRYLKSLTAGDLETAVCSEILTPDAPLWNEGRTIVEESLRESSVYFALVEQLASGDKERGELANALRIKSSDTSAYLDNLRDLRLVRRRLPLGASPTYRGGHWSLEDPFLRFWFRFVFPFQADLEAGLSPVDLFRNEIRPAISHHVAPVFEEFSRSYARSKFGTEATTVDRWWGNALHSLRRSQERSTEEIDLVGRRRNRVTLLGEAKWTSKAMGVSILRDLEGYKVPALRQDGFRIASDPWVVLLSRAGYSDDLRTRARDNDRLVLVNVEQVLSEA